MMMDDMETFVRVGTECALEAGKLLHERYRTGFAVANKGAIDLVTEVDLEAEERIVARLLGEFPDHSVLAEERHSRATPGPVCWVIDPLDGTTNYAHGYPDFSVSIALQIEGVVEWGAVYNPLREELFLARRGGGAFSNGARLAVSGVQSLDRSLLATGFPYDVRTSPRNNLADFCAFAVRCHGIRRSGSAALDLCHVAAGRLDGFWELHLNPWDCAAGYLAVREAGGRVTRYDGAEGGIRDGEVIASNGRIHAEMMEVLAAGRRKQEGV
ncbi:MAG: inositol monophosphatase [Acidobacteria bacterium]|nr:inositol monophosphatase [Acidobacteriota bacterium]